MLRHGAEMFVARRFGEKGGPYDFTTVNISQIQKKVDTLKQRLTTKKVKFHDSVLTKLDKSACFRPFFCSRGDTDDYGL